MLRHIRKTILCVYACILGGGALYAAFMWLTGTPLSCYWMDTAGICCPMCGTTRMVFCLARLDIIGAHHYQPAVLFLLVLWNAIAVLLFCGKPKILRKPKILYTLLYCSVALLVGYCFFRNIS